MSHQSLPLLASCLCVAMAGADASSQFVPQAAGQVPHVPVADDSGLQESAPTVFVGRVLGPDGAPASGAVVVTSAGGQVVTDAQGSFCLEVDVSAAAQSVRVTAVTGSGTGSLAGSAQVGGLARWGTTSAGTLVLAQASDCLPSWLPTFGQSPGVGDSSSTIHDFAVFDDGSGAALFVGGDFKSAGGVSANHVAKWNGTSWSAVGGGVNSPVHALTVFDDGTGPALYAGGVFTTAGGVSANRMAKWDGALWSALGNGMNDEVRVLAVYDDGGGPALFAGGYFTTAGIVGAKHVAKWNGSAWSTLGTGTNAIVFALAVHDDGGGPALFAGGSFTTAGGATAAHVATWDGTGWSPVGGGMNSDVSDLTVFDGGGGPALYADGFFTIAGGVAANHVAKWDGSTWSALGSGLDGFPSALAVFDDGSGPALYAGGTFTTAGGMPANSIAKWDGATWSALGSGTIGPFGVNVLATFDDGGGPALYVGGLFMTVGDLAASHAVSWNGSDWSALGDGMDGDVNALAVFDDGSGPALFAGGLFTTAGGVAAQHVAKWSGSTWSALSSGIGYFYDPVNALTVFDDGSGPALYAGGQFTIAGGETANSIARWNGSHWGPLGSGMDNSVQALAVFDDGTGPALYAGGNFTTAGGVAASRIAKWNGSTWSALGSGMGSPLVLPTVHALEVFDDGDGPALYAGGAFSTAGGVTVNRVAKWDGSTWSALGSGMDSDVHSLAVFDDGGGPALFAGGFFSVAGGVSAHLIAKWSGSGWSALGSGLSGDALSGPVVAALEAFDDGSGSALYAGGFFTTAGGLQAKRIARWNGATWSALGNGMSSKVSALAVFDDGSGPALMAGGIFSTTPDTLDSHLGKWGGCSVTPSPWTDLGFALPGAAGAPLLVGTGELLAGSYGTLTLGNAAPSSLALLFVSLEGTSTPFKCGTLVPVPIITMIPFFTDITGSVPLAWTAWPEGLSGLSLYVQHAIADPVAICGASLSNALRGDVP